MTKKVRGFEIISKDKNKNLELPQRATTGSAGYDIRASETIIVPSYVWNVQNMLKKKHDIPFSRLNLWDKFLRGEIKYFQPTIVHTGIKAYFPKNNVLELFNRSSNPVKRGLYLCNGTGVIDSDYYNNPSNEGELMAEFINLSPKDYVIHKGDRIMQGVFMPYLLTDNDSPISKKRQGGIGSTGK